MEEHVADIVCMNGWVESEGQCFKVFGAAAADRKTWQEAEAACQALEAHLATIASLAQNRAVATLVATLGFASADQMQRGAWIGLSDAVSEGDWTWANGEPSKFQAWDPGEPSNSDQTCSANGEDSARIGSKHPTGWSDAPALILERTLTVKKCVPLRLQYVCAKPASSGASSQAVSRKAKLHPACVRSTNQTMVLPHCAALAHGGDMMGCINGGWMMGTAHDSPSLPPTIVPWYETIRARCPTSQ